MRSDFWSTQVSTPENTALPTELPEKSFHEMTTLSELTPVIGWSWSTPAVTPSGYVFHAPVGSDVIETPMKTSLSAFWVNPTPERIHLELSASYMIRGSLKRKPGRSGKNVSRS